MMRVSDAKHEFHVVEVKVDDLRQIVIEAAKAELARSGGRLRAIDKDFETQVVSDQYGGFKVYFKVGVVPDMKPSSTGL